MENNNVNGYKYSKWYNNYIYNINLDEIEFQKMTYNELMSFYCKNYYDEEIESFVIDRSINGNYLPFGMSLLTLNNECNFNEYIVGSVVNNLGLRTIVCCIAFSNKYLRENSLIPVTYISVIDINKFMENSDVLNKLINALPKFINMDQNILLSFENNSLCERIMNLFREQNYIIDVCSIEDVNLEYLRDSQVKKKVL